MIRFEQKKSRNTTYYYLTERVWIGCKYKKIQVFVGKSVPNDTTQFYTALKEKEIALIPKVNKDPTSELLPAHYQHIALAQLNWKYFIAQLSTVKYQKTINHFAISFIYESNAIEGSRLSQKEVAAIVLKQYVKKSLPRHEVREAENAVLAFNHIQSHDFKISQKNIKQLHEIVISGLDIPTGFKTEAIVVNNKQTTGPKNVKAELNMLFSWYKQTKRVLHPLERALIFHNRFEHIHPFTDGNGRVGRLILNWMLLQDGYGVILFKNRNRVAYFNALDKGDGGWYRNLLTLASETYVNTISELIKQRVI